MEDSILEHYIKAGKIAAAVREKSKEFIKPDMPLIDIAEMIEEMIKKDAEIAFPVNLSLNEKTAHYTPKKQDKTLFTKDDILKVDIGVHLNGFIADTAYSISFNNNHEKLIKASEQALNAAIELCRPDTLLSKVSEAIEETITSLGFKPISNLTGHGLDQYNLHAEPQVPNIKFTSTYCLKEDQVIAIEPFATDGEGRIKDTEEILIFALKQPKATRNMDARKITRFALERQGLPFAERWIEPLMSEFKLKLALRDLLNNDVLISYPVLSEVANSFVSQAEHTIIVREDPIITTS